MVDILPGSKAGRFLMGAGTNCAGSKTANCATDEPDRRRHRSLQTAERILMAYPERDISAFRERSLLPFGDSGTDRSGESQKSESIRCCAVYDWFNAAPICRNWSSRRTGTPNHRQHPPLFYAGRKTRRPASRAALLPGWWYRCNTIDKDVDAIWKYPYDRPHCYLILSLESFLDLYMATGDRRPQYSRPSEAGTVQRILQRTYRSSISISEPSPYPPKSYLLRSGTGERGTRSGVLNQRFHLLYPEEEKYVAEIENHLQRSHANQTADGKIRYHARLIDRKEDGTDVNTCCEGQGDAAFRSVARFIYTQADDGVYVDLFAASSFAAWEQDGTPIKPTMQTGISYSSEVDIEISTHKMPCKSGSASHRGAPA